MTKNRNLTTADGQGGAVGEVFPPATPATTDTKAGSTEDLKALHSDLTAAYRDYLEMAKIKPSELNPTMLALIQQFLRHNEITAEAPQQAEFNAMEMRLEQKRKARAAALSNMSIVTLNKSKDA